MKYAKIILMASKGQERLCKCKIKAINYLRTCAFHYINMFEALYSLWVKNVKIGPSSNEVLKYRDIEIVKFESGPCCYHFFRGYIYILKPVWYLVRSTHSRQIPKILVLACLIINMIVSHSKTSKKNSHKRKKWEIKVTLTL